MHVCLLLSCLMLVSKACIPRWSIRNSLPYHVNVMTPFWWGCWPFACKKVRNKHVWTQPEKLLKVLSQYRPKSFWWQWPWKDDCPSFKIPPYMSRMQRRKKRLDFTIIHPDIGSLNYAGIFFLPFPIYPLLSLAQPTVKCSSFFMALQYFGTLEKKVFFSIRFSFNAYQSTLVRFISISSKLGRKADKWLHFRPLWCM